MKRNDLLFLGCILLYNFLFYPEQYVGVNLLLFNVALVGAMAMRNPAATKSPSWLAAAAGALLSSGSLAWHPDALPFMANFISLSLVAGFTQRPGASLPVAGFHSFCSLTLSHLTHAYNMVMSTKERSISRFSLMQRRLLVSVVPVLVTTLFLGFYVSGTPVFSSLVQSVRFDFISEEWWWFTCWGMIILSAIFYPIRVALVDQKDEVLSDELVRNRHNTPGRKFAITALKTEYQTGRVLLLMLNGLLLIVNALDVYYLFIADALPANLTYADFLHQSVGTLILSVIFAILIILYYFRGNLNFLSGNFFLKRLAYVWIAQNAILLLLTACKNGIYIGEYGLTYKRIGVYVYLLITLTGLITAYIKIERIKSNVFLFRKNAWALYCVLVVGSLFNWASIVTGYNISHPEKQLDIDYLIGLEGGNIPELRELAGNPKFNLTEKQKAAIARKQERLLEDIKLRTWKSWTYEEWSAAAEIQAVK